MPQYKIKSPEEFGIGTIEILFTLSIECDYENNPIGSAILTRAMIYLGCPDYFNEFPTGYSTWDYDQSWEQMLDEDGQL